MDLKKEYAIDPVLAEEGIDEPIGEDGDDATVKIAMMPNKAYNKFMAPYFKKYRRIGKDIPEEVYEVAMSKTLLLGWTNMFDGEKEIEPTEKNRLEMIQKYLPFKNLVLGLCTDRFLFQKNEAEAAEKNSESGRSGPSRSVPSIGSSSK